MKIEYVPAHPGNHGGKRKAEDIEYLVFHYTGNDGDRAQGNAAYFQRTVVKASAHYFVDDESIKQSVSDLTVAWAVGGKRWADHRETGGASMYGVITNSNSLSIELCDTSKDGRYMASEATQALAAQLGRYLMDKYHIPIRRVYRHFDVTGKHCPAYFMDEEAWAGFRRRLIDLGREEEDGVPRYDTVSECPEWARETIQKLIDRGHLSGDGTGLDLSHDMVRLLVIQDRAGVFGR